jgi:hypothetical protein
MCRPAAPTPPDWPDVTQTSHLPNLLGASSSARKPTFALRERCEDSDIFFE